MITIPDHKYAKFLVPLSIALLLVGVIYLIFSWMAYPNVEDEVTNEDDSSVVTQAESQQTVVFEGAYECLPWKEQPAPTNPECVFSVHTEDNQYHALDMAGLLNSSTNTKVPIGTLIRVEGMYVPAMALSSNHWQVYNFSGILRVTKFETL